VGKVFGLPKEELDALAKKFHDTNSVVALVQKYGMMLEKYPNQRSMHSCGILISEEPLQIIPFRNASQRPLALFDIAENIGFEKFDILSSAALVISMTQ
jgi:DNA polymerase-3 subunit alpha/error-prone DNA polymerase